MLSTKKGDVNNFERLQKIFTKRISNIFKESKKAAFTNVDSIAVNEVV